ncbi:MAG TPA: YdcF family protein [Candidatus Xenobia bacterium]
MNWLPLAQALSPNPLTRAIARAGQRDQSDHPADCMIVLGSKVNAHDEPGPALQARVQRAEALWRAGRAPAIIMTGGPEANHQVESLGERREAESDHIPADRLWVDTTSRTTWENLEKARDIMTANHWKSCLICTAPFHEPRSLAMARELGLTAYAAPVLDGPEVKDPTYLQRALARESLAVIKYGWQRLVRETLNRPATPKTPG